MSSTRFWVFCAIVCAVSIPLAAAETVLINEDFAADPTAAWQLNGGAAWDSPNGRVVMTPALNNRQASMFYKTPLDINNFRLEAKVKLCCGSGADGMAITFIEGDALDATRIGSGGGGMCVTNLTTGPQIVVEFDIWGNGAGCEQCATDTRDGAAGNHVGVEYSATGFDGGATTDDCIPGADHAANAACASDVSIGFDLYGNYIIDIMVQVQDATVTVDIGNPTRPIHRVITHDLTGYVPFTGLVGVTASTGGANAEQSIYSLKLTSIPAGACLEPPAAADRTLTTTQTTTVDWTEVEAYAIGSPVDVSVALSSIRVTSGSCVKPTELTVEEVIPAGWTANTISDGGSFSAGKVKWVLTGAAIADGKTLTYKAVPAGTNQVVVFVGTVTESNIPQPQSAGTAGENQLYPVVGAGIEGAGFITDWLLLGPLTQQDGDNPGVALMALDHLTNGTISELTYLPKAGDTITPDYSPGAAASTGLTATPARLEVNPGSVPTWLAWHDADDTIFFDDGNAATTNDVYETVDNCMAYGVVYVTSAAADPINCAIGCASDDSIQVILNGVSLWVHSIPRGGGATHEVQDVVPAVLNPGVNRVMVKVFEGGGGFDFRLRFQTLAGAPITSGLTVSLVPPVSGCAIPPVVVTRTITPSAPVTVEGVPTPLYLANSDLDVSLALGNVRAAGGGCSAAGNVTIVEFLPAGWTASGITGGGTFAAGKITWNLTAAQLATTTELRYTGKGGVTSGQMGIAGTLVEAGNTLGFGIGGQSTFPTDFGILPTGFITKWLILGPFYQPGADNPGLANMALDYLTDGAGVNEINVVAVAGSEVDTDYSPGAAASTGLAPAPAGINPNGIPMWVAWRDLNEAIDFQNLALYGTVDQVMAYAVCYLKVDTTQDVTVACGSDDSIQIILDDQEVWANSIPRGWGGGAPLDVSPAFSLTAGNHKLIVKVFEGGGDWNFGVRFQTPGGAPITSGIQVSLVPPGVCVPAEVTRSISVPSTMILEGVQAPAYKAGDSVAVTLSISSVRAAGGGCPALGQVTIREILPAGWTATNITAPGTFSGGAVTWVLPPAQVTEGKTLSYSASGPIAGAFMALNGSIAEQGNAVTFAIGGTAAIRTTANMTADGIILAWLLLGPLGHTSPAGAHDALIMQKDHLTDGTITELEVRPKAGDDISPDFNGAAASTGILPAVNTAINPNAAQGVAEWFEWHDADGAPVDFYTSPMLYGLADNSMAYAVTYLCSDVARTVTAAAGSDDAIQELLNGVEMGINPASRGWGGFQDVLPPVQIDAGVNVLMVKTFNGVGGFNFGVKITDEFGNPITEGISITLDPNGCGGQPQEVRVFMGNANGDNTVNIADAVTILGYLFGKPPKPAIPCFKAADTNDDNTLNVADAIDVLTFLFGAQTNPSKPMTGPDGSAIGTAACRPYPAADIPATIIGQPGCATPCP